MKPLFVLLSLLVVVYFVQLPYSPPWPEDQTIIGMAPHAEPYPVYLTDRVDEYCPGGNFALLKRADERGVVACWKKVTDTRVAVTNFGTGSLIGFVDPYWKEAQ